jgi:hypothetical protein
LTAETGTVARVTVVTTANRMRRVAHRPVEPVVG